MSQFSVSLFALVPLVLLLALIAALLFGGRVPFNYNLRNLTVRWFTTAAITLAFVVVVTLLMGMGSFVNGMYYLTAGSGHPSNVMVLSDGATDELFSNMAYGDLGNLEREKGVKDDKVVAAVKQVDAGDQKRYLASREVYLVVSQPRPVPTGDVEAASNAQPIVIRSPNHKVRTGDRVNVYQVEGNTAANGTHVVTKIDADSFALNGSQGNGDFEAGGMWIHAKPARRRLLQVRGVENTQISGLVHRMQLGPGGKWIEEEGGSEVEDLPGEKKETAIRCIIGEAVAKILAEDYGKNQLGVGDVFELGDRKWIVKGVMKSAGSTFDSEIWALQSYVGPKFNKATFTTVVLRAVDGNGQESPEAAKLLSEHLAQNFKPAVAAQPETEYYARLNQTNVQFLTGIYIIAAVLAVGGIFGLLIVMFSAINQRRKDIAVMRIIGYKRWQVLMSFLLESMLIALIGGLLGCAIIYSITVFLQVIDYSFTSVVSSGQGGGKTIKLKMIVDVNLVCAGLLFSLVCGLVGGLLPSILSMRVRPLEALR